MVDKTTNKYLLSGHYIYIFYMRTKQKSLTLVRQLRALEYNFVEGTLRICFLFC